MLQINKLTDYATVIMSYLANNPRPVLSAAHIAKAIHLGVPTVSKVLKMLFEASLVKSFRGNQGGYQLARAMQDITLADVVTAIEGRLAITECATEKKLCALDSLCAIKHNWQIINKIILDALGRITLYDMTHSLTDRALTLHDIPIKMKVKS